jgi:hypothetical protein
MRFERQRLQTELESRGIKYKSIHFDSAGGYRLNLSGTVVTDLFLLMNRSSADASPPSALLGNYRLLSV